jgi:hypothetical protein
VLCSILSSLRVPPATYSDVAQRTKQEFDVNALYSIGIVGPATFGLQSEDLDPYVSACGDCQFSAWSFHPMEVIPFLTHADCGLAKNSA